MSVALEINVLARRTAQPEEVIRHLVISMPSVDVGGVADTPATRTFGVRSDECLLVVRIKVLCASFDEGNIINPASFTPIPAHAVGAKIIRGTTELATPDFKEVQILDGEQFLVIGPGTYQFVFNCPGTVEFLRLHLRFEGYILPVEALKALQPSRTRLIELTATEEVALPEPGSPASFHL